MTVSKYVHSCLIVEDDGERLLFDPGVFSFRDGRVSPDAFANVDLVVLTHTHPDHLDPDALRQIVALSGAPVVTNTSGVARLADDGLRAEAHDAGERAWGAFTLTAVETPHEPVLGAPPPTNTAFLVNGRFLNPGDSFGPALDVFAGVDLLALPVSAPFLTEVGAVAFAKRLRPKAVLPVHDGFLRPDFVAQRYDAYAPEIEALGATFHRAAAVGARVEVG